MQPDGRRAVPGDHETVPLLQEQRLAPLLADQLVAAGVRGGGRGPGGGTAPGRELLGELGELVGERGRPQGDVGEDPVDGTAVAQRTLPVPDAGVRAASAPAVRVRGAGPVRSRAAGTARPLRHRRPAQTPSK